MEKSNKIFNGNLYINKKTGQLLDGNYRFTEPDDPNVTFERFNDGRPEGNWENYCYGDLIHSGSYLEKDSLTAKIGELANAKDFFVDIWQEGETKEFLTIALVAPEINDTMKFISAIKPIVPELRKVYQCKYVEIVTVNDLTRETLFKEY